MEQEVEVEVDRGLLSVPKPAAASTVVWASPAFLFRLVLSLALLVFPCPAVAARVSSSLSTTHHVHHFHNKHGTVPIAINRMPFLTRGGHEDIGLQEKRSVCPVDRKGYNSIANRELRPKSGCCSAPYLPESRLSVLMFCKFGDLACKEQIIKKDS
ncbi:unnamed protein product [Pleuronectes platessa]|uniref:Uncharacterized protein n=1 Tax=Pleuronectes platessa TaxID=8262 RepID=A0A9N7U958_PLEPL|nr:unnamed protein product [Pleuronectes platessa]